MNDKVKIVLWVVLGMAIMFILLKILSKGIDKSSVVWEDSKKILLSVQFYNLTKTNEFRELLKMPETTDLLKNLASEQLTTISQSLI